MIVGTFPFGQPVEPVVQADRGSKRVFVLGVYPSAVHARWLDIAGKTLVKALGVASEPAIFWRGDGVEAILSHIDVPVSAGRLVPAKSCFNGPSGRSLDEHYLQPLGFARSDAWLCDLIPYSCMNEGQAGAIRRCYAPIAKRLGLPVADWPVLPASRTDAVRREAIAAELRASEAELLITLGDQPLRWFAAPVLDAAFSSLAAYGSGLSGYGQVHPVEFEDRRIGLLPLVHPRQAARLGDYTSSWHHAHSTWLRHEAPELRGRL